MIEKHLFGELIHLNDATGVDTYPKDISLMFRWMQNLQLPPHPTILDIGANVGLFSLSYASIFKGAEIHCFEPVPFIYNFLKKNLEINPHLNSSVHAHSFGMSNCKEWKQLSIPSAKQHERYNDQSDIRLYSVLGLGRKKFDAEFITLDQWVNDFKVRSLDFIKIDVEGYEYSVLQGAMDTLRSFRPILMFELNQLTLSLSNRTADEYLRLAKDLDYNVFGLEYGFKSKLLKINSINQVDLVSDLILFPS